jgi:polo-like kinase 1
VTISSEAKNLIKGILVGDPRERLTIEEIFEHKFLTKSNVPKLLPVSTLACPPSASYMR